ncbi:MAG: DUF2752 domain-containing protein [Myxococcota bacterium]
MARSAAPPLPRVGQGERFTWLLLLALPLFAILTATQLTPDPVGHGTHTQLGLPPCGFLLVTGFPCPGCGLTTCFTHMVRFEFVDAVRANPFGVALFLVCAFGVPIAAAGFLRGWPIIDTLERVSFDKVAIALSASSIVVFVARVAAQLLR